jgi:uncharacterized protein (UPF0248 family)
VIPIHELFNRIRWDREYAGAEFEVGYYDRLEERIIRVTFRQLYFDPEDHFNFQLLDAEGERLTIPLHRVKSLWRNGELIWHREH